MTPSTKRKIVSCLKVKIGRNDELGQLTQKEISLSTGIHQSQISRFMAGDFVYASDKLKALCDFLDINWRDEKKMVEDNELLMGSLRRVWDGSEKHAQVIAMLLDSLAVSQTYIAEK